MREVLIVVDMQNDFIDGALANPMAQEIISKVVKLKDEFQGEIIYTRDTHEKEYLMTQEGRNLPVEHCIKGTQGWEIQSEVYTDRAWRVFDKPCFGSTELGAFLVKENEKEPIDRIVFAGVCTDICVISNVLLVKAFLPEVPLVVRADCCAGVTKEAHENALYAMQACQVTIEGTETANQGEK